MFTRKIEFRHCSGKQLPNGNLIVEFRDLVPMESVSAELDSIRSKWELTRNEQHELETVLDKIVLHRLIEERMVNVGGDEPAN